MKIQFRNSALTVLALNALLVGCNHSDPQNAGSGESNTISAPSDSNRLQEISDQSKENSNPPVKDPIADNSEKNSDEKPQDPQKTEVTPPVNVCTVRDLKGKKGNYPIIDSSFWDQLDSNPIEAVRSWLITSKTFKNADTSNLKVTKPIEETHSNVIYYVSNNEQNYVVKTTSCNSFDKAFEFNQTIYAHPECLTSEDHKKTGFPVPTDQDLKKLPRISKVLEVAQIKDHSICIGLSEHAAGIQLHKLSKKAPHDLTKSEISSEKADLYTALGESLGTMHYYFSEYKAGDSTPIEKLMTFSHGDLYSDNIFFDETTGQFSFINLHATSRHKPALDIYTSGTQPMNYWANQFAQDFFSDVYHGAEKRFKATKWFWTKWSKPNEWIILDPKMQAKYMLEEIRHILSSKVSGREKEYHFATSETYHFMKGYLRPLPKELKDAFTKHFQETCQNSLTSKLKSKFDLPHWNENDRAEFEKLISNIENRNPDLVRCIEGKFE